MSDFLLDVGLATSNGLSESGSEIFRTRWIRKQSKEALQMLGESLRVLVPVQVFEQELRNYGTIDEEAALDLLKLHRVVDASVEVDQLRRELIWLNEVGLIAYSKKNKTVRSLAPPSDAAAVGEDARLPVMISPRTRYGNLARLRKILRTRVGTVWWVDPHFGRRALEDLADELVPLQVDELRILSGASSDVVSSKSLRDFEYFRDEMSTRGLRAEWRVDALRDWHDRWLLDDGAVYNMPPINTLYKGDYSEILPSSVRPPVEEWWNRSTAR